MSAAATAAGYLYAAGKLSKDRNRGARREEELNMDAYARAEEQRAAQRQVPVKWKRKRVAA